MGGGDGGFQCPLSPGLQHSLEQTSPPDCVHCVAPGVAPESQSQQQASNYQIIGILKLFCHANYPSMSLGGRHERLLSVPPAPPPSSSRQDAEDSCPIVADDTLLYSRYVNILSLPQTVPYVSALAFQVRFREPVDTVCRASWGRSFTCSALSRRFRLSLATAREP